MNLQKKRKCSYKIQKRFFSFIIIFFLFQSIIFSFSFNDIIFLLHKDKKKSLQIAQKGIAFFNKISNHLIFSKKTNKFFIFLRQSFEEFDFNQLYNSNYFSFKQKGYKKIIFTGKQDKKSYKVSLSDKSYEREQIIHLGDFVSEFGLKKNNSSIVKEPSFSGYFKLKSNTQEFNYKKSIQFIEMLQQIIDNENIKKLNAKESILYPNIKKESKKVINDFSIAFPRFANLLYQYTHLSSLLKIAKYNNKTYTKLIFKGKLKLNILKQKYTELYEYLDDLDDLMRFRMVIVDEHWNKLMTFIIDSKNKEIIWMVNTKNNKVIPEDWQGRPVFKHQFALSKLIKKRFYLSTNIHINIYGLKFDTQDIKIKSIYQNIKNKGSFFFKIHQFPKIKVSGYFWHIIPTWLIDLFIPGNIDILINKFTKVLQYGNNGQGSFMKVNWFIQNQTKSIINLYGKTELLDNRFIRIAMKIFNRRFLPNEKAFLELRLLAGKFIQQLQLDIQNKK